MAVENILKYFILCRDSDGQAVRYPEDKSMFYPDYDDAIAQALRLQDGATSVHILSTWANMPDTSLFWPEEV